MANSFMADIGSLGSASFTAKKSTSRAGNTEMKMEDFLYLMVVQLQNQTIDDTADTGDMLNQMVQMQMVTALANMTDASIMSYASSLVGKEVTIGILNGGELEERVLTVIGTGLYDGEQVIFCDDGNMYSLSQIMAVGRLPDLSGLEEPDEEPDTGLDIEDVGAVGPKEDEELDPGFNIGDVESDGDEELDPDFNAGDVEDSESAGDVESGEDQVANSGFDNEGVEEAGPDNGTTDDGLDIGDVESSSDAGAETGDDIDEPFYDGLPDGIPEDPGGENPEYTGEQGAPADTE